MEQISLTSARVNAGYTIANVAKIINKTEKTISNWENGITPISAEMFYRLCDMYKISRDSVRVPIVNDGKY